MAFWHLGCERLVVAVLARTADEPLLLACATIAAEAQAPQLVFAPGIVEAAAAVSAQTLCHVAALAENHCRIINRGDEEPDERDGTVRVPIAGVEESSVEADVRAVDTAVTLFRHARLRLRTLDCAPCAVLSLQRFLALGVEAVPAGAPVPDPLAAVSVAPGCEQAATDLGVLLTVPVGLALATFGFVNDRAG